MDNAIAFEYLRFLKDLGLTEERFSKRPSNGLCHRGETFRRYEAFGQTEDAQSRCLKPLYATDRLEAGRMAFGHLLKGDRHAAEELLMIFDKSRAEFCYYVFGACRAGRLPSSVLGRVMRRLIDQGTFLSTLLESGRSADEIVEMFLQADPEDVMSAKEYKAFCSLPQEVKVFRGIAGKTIGTIGQDMSWTLSRELALGFAKRHGQRLAQQGQLWNGSVKRRDILLYLGDREEEEVIVRPGRIRRLAYKVLGIAASESSERLKVEEAWLRHIFNYGATFGKRSGT